jgi:type II secretory ATPase GspE/PulE/Tfp pilus assembly ATPase PilB-like protein
MDAIRKKAVEQGMTTMVCDGITKALMGITTLQEVRRVAKV